MINGITKLYPKLNYSQCQNANLLTLNKHVCLFIEWQLFKHSRQVHVYPQSTIDVLYAHHSISKYLHQKNQKKMFMVAVCCFFIELLTCCL